MKRRIGTLIDRKHWLTYSVLNLVNHVAVESHFEKLDVVGREKLPSGAFILISNHTTRWDGPVVQQVIQRPANYMVSPNELKGLQGFLLQTFGAFPANPKFDLLSFMRSQAAKHEPIVIFPEGDIYRDGATHQFKTGAAKTALLCASNELNVPVVPIAIRYGKETKPETPHVLIGDPIDVRERVDAFKKEPLGAVRTLTNQLYREVCHLRMELGSKLDRDIVFEGKPFRSWAHHAMM
jgi:1-acyl-sn-glycerol-3-phosphate acyltransferase